MCSSLAQLPPELLSHIVSHLETAQSLLRLSLSCKNLHAYIEKDGFRVFIQHQFPSIRIPPYWKDAAHALTTLSRAWDRKSFIAYCIEPGPAAVRLPRGRHKVENGRRQRRQTMGYQPVVDSYEDWLGGDWTSRREVLALGAGAELVMRVKSKGDEIEREWQQARSREERRQKFDQHHHKSDWVVYKEDGYKDGRDDITSVSLLRPIQKYVDESEQIVIGRASGWLEQIRISTIDAQSSIMTRYSTQGRRVQSATVNSTPEPLLAACLGDENVAIYSVHSVRSSEKTTKQSSEVSVIPSGKAGRTWSTRFLCHNRLAVGLGPSTEPLHVYDIHPSGISKDPLRIFSKHSADPKMMSDDRVDVPGNSTGSLSSVYSISPISSSSHVGGVEGDLFLSGWYDGIIRLHDLRSPDSCTAIFQDPIDASSAIYSLLPLARSRFLAGSARHSIVKVFDLRLPGSKAYQSSNLEPPQHSTGSSHRSSTAPARPNWSLFLTPHMPSYYRNPYRSAESPVYSLSSPSPCSPTFFAGIENNLVQFDMTAMMDEHPDPVWRYGPRRTGARDADVSAKWDPGNRAKRLAVYEQVDIGSMRLKEQGDVGCRIGGVEGWDERWGDVRGGQEGPVGYDLRARSATLRNHPSEQ